MSGRRRAGAGGCHASDADYFASNGGCLSLLSSGESPRDSEFVDASADGSDVFIRTESSLVKADPGLVDIYDARIGGGFPEPEQAALCEGQACQNPPAAPQAKTPASAQYNGPGNVKEAKSSRCAKPARRAQIALQARPPPAPQRDEGREAQPRPGAGPAPQGLPPRQAGKAPEQQGQALSQASKPQPEGRQMKRLTLAFTVLAACLALAPSAHAAFGVSHFDLSFEEAGGGSAALAGSHPDAMKVSIAFNYHGSGEAAVPDGDIENFAIAQIPGLVADTTAIPRCSTADFLSTAENKNHCQADAKVGEVNVVLTTPTNKETVALYNVTPPPGTLLRLGFKGVGLVPVVIDVGLKTSSPYDGLALTRFAHQTLKVFGVNLTLWGIPARHGTGAPERPFLTLPSSCLGPQLTSYEALSWPSLDPVSFAPLPSRSDSGSALTHDGGEPPAPRGFAGCGELGFHPAIDAAATTAAAQSPSGLDFDLRVPDPGLTSTAGRAGSEVRKTVVTLPPGMSANPSLAEGLAGCSEAELARESPSSAPGEGCPQAAKIGSAEVESPLVEETLSGSLYVASPYENPFHSLLALYIVIKSPELGILVTQPVEVEPTDEGQLIATAPEVPQLPFSSFRVHLREGGRSPLISPPECGSHAVSAELTPWAGGATADGELELSDLLGPRRLALPLRRGPALRPGLCGGLGQQRRRALLALRAAAHPPRRRTGHHPPGGHPARGGGGQDRRPGALLGCPDRPRPLAQRPARRPRRDRAPRLPGRLADRLGQRRRRGRLRAHLRRRLALPRRPDGRRAALSRRDRPRPGRTLRRRHGGRAHGAHPRPPHGGSAG